MALNPSLITAIVAGASGLLGALIPIVTAKITSGPSAEDALTKRFTALTERMDREREGLEKKIAKLEANLADLEIKIIRDAAWGDQIQILMDRRGVKYPPRPQFEPHISTG